jgi:hypothetical protein
MRRNGIETAASSIASSPDALGTADRRGRELTGLVRDSVADDCATLGEQRRDHHRLVVRGKASGIQRCAKLSSRCVQ